MKRIKFPLVMGNGAEARDIEGLRENFDMERAAEYFSNGKLERWLENNYYDDILEAVRELDSSQDDFGKKLTEALGVKWEDTGTVDLQAVMKRTELRERLKPYVSEEQLKEMEYIADSQEELERLAKMGCGRVYLFGEEFQIPGWMERIECIGINRPVVSVETQSREEYKGKGIKLKEVDFATKEMETIARGNSSVDIFYELLDVMELYLENVQKALG